MSTPIKENAGETSDPGKDTSGEVSQKIVLVHGLDTRVRDMDDKFELRLELLWIKMDDKFEALKARMAVQEARMSPPRSRGGTPEPDKTVLALSKVNPETQARTRLHSVNMKIGRASCSRNVFPIP